MSDWKKVHQRGSGAESRARALWAEQGLYKQNFRAIVSQSEPESGKESQWMSECELQHTIGSQLVPEKDQLGPIRARESTREPERELESKPVSQAEWARGICQKLLLLTRALPSIALSGSLFSSFWLSLALSGSLWLWVALSLAIFGSLWCSLAHCLSWGLSGSYRLTRCLLGLRSRSCIA